MRTQKRSDHRTKEIKPFALQFTNYILSGLAVWGRRQNSVLVVSIFLSQLVWIFVVPVTLGYRFWHIKGEQYLAKIITFHSFWHFSADIIVLMDQLTNPLYFIFFLFLCSPTSRIKYFIRLFISYNFSLTFVWVFKNLFNFSEAFPSFCSLCTRHLQCSRPSTHWTTINFSAYHVMPLRK